MSALFSASAAMKASFRLLESTALRNPPVGQPVAAYLSIPAFVESFMSGSFLVHRRGWLIAVDIRWPVVPLRAAQRVFLKPAVNPMLEKCEHDDHAGEGDESEKDITEEADGAHRRPTFREQRGSVLPFRISAIPLLGLETGHAAARKPTAACRVSAAATAH